MNEKEWIKRNSKPTLSGGGRGKQLKQSKSPIPYWFFGLVFLGACYCCVVTYRTPIATASVTNPVLATQPAVVPQSKAQLLELALQADEAVGNPRFTTPCAITQESQWRFNARSPVGALGLAQIMPTEAKQAGINPLNPRQAIGYMAKRLHKATLKYKSMIAGASSYNGGSGAVAYFKGHGWYPNPKAKAGSYRGETGPYFKQIVDCILNRQMEEMSNDNA